ncbi:MAG: hypothetical protein JXB33_08550 [Clostridia bacterium]|nr:hypothetical protein [Clostridia bacterium]
MKNFSPDYNNIVSAAQNRKPKRIPVYEHQISEKIISSVMNKKLDPIDTVPDSGIDEYFRIYCDFFLKMQYDTVSFERILSGILPGNGALYGHEDGCIKTYEDFVNYPWDEIKNKYFESNDRYFKALDRNLPRGMKAIGGVGNGIFECVQDIVGYINLCYIKIDDENLYRSLFLKMGDLLLDVWDEFLKRYSNIFCVMRMGDDLGFKTNTLLPPEDIIDNIIPKYKDLAALVHSFGKPFLLHSCGNIFSIMDNLIDAGFDAKHSNEDEIAPMSVWYEKYGDKIGNFGGIDADILCRFKTSEINDYVSEIYAISQNYKGVALGSGNSIPDYVPVENYIEMVQTIINLRS